MRIAVTEDDIWWGERESHKRCPIANAMRRNGLCGCEVYNGEAHWIDLEKSTDDMHVTNSADLPYDARIFVVNFDRGHPVDPFEFELEGA